MSIKINEIDLGDLALRQLFDRKIDAEIRYSIDGTPIIFEKDKKMHYIDLYGGEDWGWLKYKTIKELYNLANAKGAIYSLLYNDTEHKVIFRNDAEPIECEPVLIKDRYNDDDYFNNIVIKLIKI